MLMNMKELLKVADEKGFAVPAFNIGSDQLLKAVMQQVKEMKSPVILDNSVTFSPPIKLPIAISNPDATTKGNM